MITRAQKLEALIQLVNSAPNTTKVPTPDLIEYLNHELSMIKSRKTESTEDLENKLYNLLDPEDYTTAEQLVSAFHNKFRKNRYLIPSIR